MVYLLSHLPFLLEASWFDGVWVYSAVVYLCPLALVAQLITSVTYKQQEIQGVSVLTFSIILLVLVLVALGAVKTASITLFVSMTVSAIESLSIILIVLIRRKKDEVEEFDASVNTDTEVHDEN